MRRVIYRKFVEKEKSQQHVLEVQGQADFHAFGMDYEELDNGEGYTAGNFSTAIIELDDGTVKSIPVEHIKFIRNDIDIQRNIGVRS